jgi:LytS/YehU family sensor histidine kinase
LVLNIKNSAEPQLQSIKKEGVGLKYVKKRLELSYCDNYELELTQDTDSYNVQLILNLTSV